MQRGRQENPAWGYLVAESGIFLASQDLSNESGGATVAKYAFSTHPPLGRERTAALSASLDGWNVYVAGSEFEGGHTVAKIWKNGIPRALTDGSGDATATAVLAHAF